MALTLASIIIETPLSQQIGHQRPRGAAACQHLLLHPSRASISTLADEANASRSKPMDVDGLYRTWLLLAACVVVEPVGVSKEGHGQTCTSVVQK